MTFILVTDQKLHLFFCFYFFAYYNQNTIIYKSSFLTSSFLLKIKSDMKNYRKIICFMLE